MSLLYFDKLPLFWEGNETETTKSIETVKGKEFGLHLSISSYIFKLDLYHTFQFLKVTESFLQRKECGWEGCQPGGDRLQTSAPAACQHM